jgi:hypothetical protein
MADYQLAHLSLSTRLDLAAIFPGLEPVGSSPPRRDHPSASLRAGSAAAHCWTWSNRACSWWICPVMALAVFTPGRRELAWLLGGSSGRTEGKTNPSPLRQSGQQQSAFGR